MKQYEERVRRAEGDEGGESSIDGDTFIGKRVWHSVRECATGILESELSRVEGIIVGL